ncbi:hypothetical protein ND748_13375 [Frankia sp. AiPs1]|uniref:phosphotransferase n=1 Tax=Frankia sp. AiPs1 TaxID=573493 RepID=UPI002043D085|nr:phosphotransferase [Frankia sp. AiPs1]MCM3922646.1 hypothetical protein [Frankia sp. AiPs1]
MTDTLLAAQRLQFTDRPRAEVIVKGFVRDLFDLDITSVELRPSSVSLNSINGLMFLRDGRALFFKTHTEPDSRIDEYYNAKLLKSAGYPVVDPVFGSTRSGRQLLVYEVIDAPTLFDEAWRAEQGSTATLAALAEAQHRLDRTLARVQFSTLEWQEADEAAGAPVHQLFFHRLMGRRLDEFLNREHTYEAGNRMVSVEQIRRLEWNINGQRYSTNLDHLIDEAAKILDPQKPGPSIVGHGDGHNGNAFFQGSERCPKYFDPAFAGRHNPLLDFVKPLYHNVFAMWMYFPDLKHQETTLASTVEDGRICVEHDYSLHPVRQMFLWSKFSNVIVPMVSELRNRGWLRDDWRRYVKSALLCCPLLTVNFGDRSKYSAKIAWLALSSAVEMGAESGGRRSIIDQFLDEVELQTSGLSSERPVRVVPAPTAPREQVS